MRNLLRPNVERSTTKSWCIATACVCKESVKHFKEISMEFHKKNKN